ncbi:hypothetical protein ECG_06824 [Echinococcus granulosus]|uniref:Transcription factor FAR1 n=1 Tax=Echinococcus granulosus TaxID=6210 RepID=A0A068WG46_ECHGR|nr:hypothetical protein ECG_06824 [Echinococcus granulosus]CDS19083.1 Transcription factor FAR1 [Echinococcus granulosus]
MDASQLFSDLVACRRYPTFDAFQQSLRGFQGKSGYVFIKGNSNRFKEGHPLRSTLVYRSVVYFCSSYSGRGNRKRHGTDCNAHIKVSGAGGILTVVDWNMVHNHSIQGVNLNSKAVDGETVDRNLTTTLLTNCDGQNDQTELFMTVFPQMWFSVFTEFEEKLREFEHISGTHYNKWKGDKFRTNRKERDTLVYRRLTYACYHYGESRQQENSRNRTPKIGCNSTIVLRAENNILRIVRFDMQHCHAVGPEYVETSPKLSRKRPKNPNIEELPPLPLVPPLEEPHFSRTASTMTRGEKLEIISQHLNRLANFACSHDDAHFYRVLEVVRSIYEGWNEQPFRHRLTSSSHIRMRDSVDTLGGHVDVVPP